MNFFATCKMGLESLVSSELRRLGIKVEKVSDARVDFSGGYSDMANACLWLRTAERVLMSLGEFEAETFEELFEGVKEIAWKQYLRKNSNIHVNGKSAKSALFSVSDCQSIAKKAIIENLKTAYKTSDFPEDGDEIIIEIGILRNMVTVALDCCGAGLSRRGYRTYNVQAPISETLGAAIVMLGRYQRDAVLVDPMCGSGTMPIEAAMIASNIAPGLGRSFSAENWHFTEKDLFGLARERAKSEEKRILPEIFGSDIDPRAIDLCKKHAKKAGVMLNWAVCPLSDLKIDRESGIIVVNPPYGDRLMKPKEVDALYREMRVKFDSMPRFSANIITTHKNFESVYGKRADKRRKLSNGGLVSTLYSYFSR